MAAAAAFNLEEYKKRMDGALAALQHEFGGLRTGRASATLLERMSAGLERQRCIGGDGRAKVEPSRMLSLIGWERQVRAMRQPHHFDGWRA